MTGVVKELHQSMLGGQSWGNIICDEEDEALEKMSDVEKAALEVKKAADEVERKEGVMQYSVDLRKKLYTNQTTGLANRRFNRHCKKERYHGEMCPNKALLSTVSCNPKYGCGCKLHKERKGACSFVHADEENEMASLFMNFGMKILDDKPFIATLFKMDKLKEKANANPAARYVLEKEARALEMETDAIEMRFKREQRCVWVIVNANNTVSYSRTPPDTDGYSAKSSGRSSTSSDKQQTSSGKQQTPNKMLFKKSDNSAW
jgi:hypothetical protein